MKGDDGSPTDRLVCAHIHAPPEMINPRPAVQVNTRVYPVLVYSGVDTGRRGRQLIFTGGRVLKQRVRLNVTLARQLARQPTPDTPKKTPLQLATDNPSCSLIRR